MIVSTWVDAPAETLGQHIAQKMVLHKGLVLILASLSVERRAMLPLIAQHPVRLSRRQVLRG